MRPEWYIRNIESVIINVLQAEPRRVNTLAPYASNYKLPNDLPRSDGPVHVTLALGVVGQQSLDDWEQAMDWEELVPNSQDVLDAVRHLRDGDGLVDMEVDLPWELGTPQRSHGAGTVVVVDTNILISHLPLVRDFVKLCSALPASERPTLLIPHIVLRELDGLKTSARSTNLPAHSSAAHRGNRMTASISTLARAATNWLLSSIDATEVPSIVRGQRKSETLFSQHALRHGENNDSLVLDAAAFFLAQSKRVVLLSDDNNLRLRAKFEKVEALSVDARIGDDASQLLATVEPSLAGARPHQPRPRTPPPKSNGHSSPPRPSPVAPRSPPSPPPLLSRPKPTPIPLPSTIARSSSMHLDPSDTVPLHSNPHPPTLLPPTSASAIFSNLLTLFSHFLALPLYKTVYNHFGCLPDGRTEQQRQLLEELGDWRTWDALECARVIKRWWDEGGVRQLCEKGYENLLDRDDVPPASSASPPLPPPPPPVASPPRTIRALPTKKPVSPPPPRPSRPSRWAPVPPLSSPSSSPPLSHSRPTPSPPVAPATSPPPRSTTHSSSSKQQPPSIATVTAAVSKLHSTLPYLISTFSLITTPRSTESWSPLRFELLLESVENWFVVILSAVVHGRGVRTDVERLVETWKMELRAVGVRVGIGK